MRIFISGYIWYLTGYLQFNDVDYNLYIRILSIVQICTCLRQKSDSIQKLLNLAKQCINVV